MSYDVIVIGAGHNGLTAAAWLAKAGRRVMLLERRGVVGGLATGDPATGEAGPLTDTSGFRPFIVDHLQLERFGLERQTPTPVLIPQVDGPGLVLHQHEASFQDDAGPLSESDVESFVAYRHFIDSIGPLARQFLDQVPPDLGDSGLSGLLPLARNAWSARRTGRKTIAELLRIVPMSLDDWLSEWFESDLLRAALALPALAHTFAGPRSPGTTASLLRLECLTGQSVVGGCPKLIESLNVCAEQAGVEIRTGCAVEQINVSNGAVEGVLTSTGETLRAPTVVATCSPIETFTNLLDHLHIDPALQEQVRHIRARGTTAIATLTCSRPPTFSCRPDQEFARVRIVDHPDAIEQAFDPIKYNRLPDAPALEMTSTPTQDGGVSLSVHIHFVPHDATQSDGGWSSEDRNRLLDVVVDRLSHYAPNLAQTVTDRTLMTPTDLSTRFALPNGDIYHCEHALDQFMVRPTRSLARFSTPISGLHLASSGSHAGGGLTGGPGALASMQILR